MAFHQYNFEVPLLNHLDNAACVPQVRHGDEKETVRFQHAGNLSNDSSVIQDMLNSFGADHRVEARAAIWQPERISLGEKDAWMFRRRKA